MDNIVKTHPTRAHHVPTNAHHPHVRWIVEAFADMADDVILDDKQVAALAGYEVATIKAWRRTGRGPRFIDIHGRPRTTAGLYREWLAGLKRAC